MLEINIFKPLLVKTVADFFSEIQFENDKNFHPHGFSTDEAERLCNRHASNDLYCAVTYSKNMIAYGLLRGWDDGYDVPSLGIYVSSRYRGNGIGKMLMEYLHCAAKLKGAKKIRLKVYKNNNKAIKLYSHLGYTFEDHDEKQLVGIKEI